LIQHVPIIGLRPLEAGPGRREESPCGPVEVRITQRGLLHGKQVPMTVQTTTPVDHSHNSSSEEPVSPSRRQRRRKGSGLLKFLIFVTVVAAIGGGTYQVLGKEKSLAAANYLKDQVWPTEAIPEPDAMAPPRPKTAWNGLVKVSEEEQKAVGFKIATVEPQTKPIKLEINGTTDYDQNSLNKVRPRFDNALVEKVYVSAGQRVKKGDPLLDLRSAELGQARNDCRTAFVQWDHDHKYLVAREPLAKDGRITQIIWVDTQNSEKQSRLSYLVSREKLATYGMTHEQVEKLLEGLSDDRKKALEADDRTEDITRMTMVSPIDGIVVERDVVPGNFYDQTKIMLTISPMTELWVWGNVFESDQDKVHIGQNWDIELQFSKEHFEGKVESIANGVDPDTRTLRIRATIDNRSKDLKAGMLVRFILQIPPREGDTIIPRNALSVINGEFFAFVQKEGTGEDADLFERRKLEVDQENTDQVVVKKGLKAGERVVSNGALILSQMYEDLSTVETGLPVQ
jgi:membrane fusion protein, heavy metal efflux system